MNKSKKVSFGLKPQSIDQWVGAEEEETKRLTLDIPKSLHGRFKADCALKGDNMKDVIMQFLMEKYPPAA